MITLLIHTIFLVITSLQNLIGFLWIGMSPKAVPASHLGFSGQDQARDICLPHQLYPWLVYGKFLFPQYLPWSQTPGKVGTTDDVLCLPLTPAYL